MMTDEIDWQSLYQWGQQNKIDETLLADFTVAIKIKKALDDLDRPVDRLRVLQHVADVISQSQDQEDEDGDDD